MTYEEALAHFGTQVKLADALGITQGSVSAWEGVIPPLRQLQIQNVTRGRLKADADVFDRKPSQAGAEAA